MKIARICVFVCTELVLFVLFLHLFGQATEHLYLSTFKEVIWTIFILITTINISYKLSPFIQKLTQ